MTTPITTLTLSAAPQVLRAEKGSARLRYPTAQEMREVRPRTRRSVADRLSRLYIVGDGGCWRWTGSVTTTGYGHCSIASRYYQAHRLLYILHRGDIADGLELDHTCRNRWCVNPWHLDVVSHAVNSQRGARTHLRSDQVEAIRNAHAMGVGVRAQARWYGVHHATISRIVNERTWKPETSTSAEAA